MKTLIVYEGGAGAILPLVPLAHGLRSAGHEVMASAHAEFTSILLEAGVPAVAAPHKSPRDYRVIRDGKLVPLGDDLDERAVVLGAIGAQIAADTYHALLDLAERWRPDLIIGGPLAYAAPLLSAKLDIPFVAVEFGMAEPVNWHLATLSELDRLGCAELATPVLCLSMCPESIRPSVATDPQERMRYLPAEPLRYLPFAPAQPVEPWMYSRGSRPRVWVSGGSRVSDDYALDYLTGLISAAAELDVELLVATPDHLAARLGTTSEHARVGWLPFDVLAPTCDLAVHHGGGSTMLGCLANGIPQVIIPFMPEAEVYVDPVRAYGAAKVVPAEENTPTRVLAACQEVLAEPSYREASTRLQAEMAAAPSPWATVARLERLVAAGA